MSNGIMRDAAAGRDSDDRLDRAFAIYDSGASPVVAGAERVGRALREGDDAALDALERELDGSIRPADVEALAVLRAVRAQRAAG